MKKTKAELMEERARLEAERTELRQKREALVSGAEAAKRTLTSEETNQVEEMRGRIAMLSTKIDTLSAEIEAPVEPDKRSKKTEATQEKPIGLLRFFREVMAGELSEESRAINKRGAEECRAAGVAAGKYSIPLVDARALVSVAATGEHTVATELQKVLAPLRQTLVLTQAGATLMTGCRGDIKLPAYSGTNAGWVEEGGKAADGSGTFSSKVYKPHRLTTVIELTEQFLLQDSVDAEEMLMRDLLAAISSTLESTALGSGAATGGAPAGVFSGTVADKGKASYERFVDIEAGIDTANALMGNLAYITNPKGKAILRKTFVGKSEYNGVLTDGKTLNEYKLLSTTGCATNLNTGQEGIIFANFQDFVICQWGGLGVTVDTVTKADEGKIRFIISSYWDFGFRRPESYKVASIQA